MPQGQGEHELVIQCNHMLHFLVRHRPTLVGIFISCCPCSLFAGDCGKAWREKIPERSEDDFSRQPHRRAALRNQPGKRLSLRQEMKKRTSSVEFTRSACGLVCRVFPEDTVMHSSVFVFSIFRPELSVFPVYPFIVFQAEMREVGGIHVIQVLGCRAGSQASMSRISSSSS